MNSNFITNQDKFLSDIINGIFPKTKAVNILVGYFFYSGYATISERLKNKKVRILVGLDVDTNITKLIHKIKDFKQTIQSLGKIEEDYYNKFVKLFNDTNFLDTEDKIKQFKLFYDKIVDGTLEIRKTIDPCHSKCIC